MSHQQRAVQPRQIPDKQKSITIGNYVLGKTLGKGTFGKVKLAEQTLTGQKVAIKILQKDRIVDVADVQRVSREIHILKLIRHPNIIQLYEIIETPKQLFLVMEYLQNGELFDYIVKKKQRIPQDEVCQLFQQIISGVEYIHKLNIVHRDLKPENLLLDYDNTIRLVDFGLSNTYQKDQRLKTACGSPCYAAPEMIEGKKKYEPILVDIWSCGVILYAMLCSSLPFQDEQTSKLYQKILSGQYSKPKHLSPDAKDLLSKILNVDPTQRYRIEDIKKHKWWSLHPEIPCSSGLIVGFHKMPIDFNILDRLRSLQMDVDLVQKCLEASRHNSSTTTYYLLLKKFIREGGVSKADLGSKYFDISLIQPNQRKQIKSNNFTGNQFVTGRSEESKKDARYNYLNLLKGKLGSTGEPQQRDRSARFSRQDLEPRSTKNMRMAHHQQVKIPTSTKRGRSPLHQDNGHEDRLNKKYRQKYGAAIVSRSPDKSRRNSAKHHDTNHNINLFEQKFKEYHVSDRKRSSLTKNYKRPLTGSRDQRDILLNSTARTPGYKTHHQPQIKHLGLDTSYGNHMSKWKRNVTMDTKSNEKPYINRRSHYH